MTTYICTVFYKENSADESNYPNMGLRSTTDKFQEVYWKNISVFFASSSRFNPDCRHLLFTNSEPPKDSIRGLLIKLGVEIINLDYRHHPPRNYWGEWQSTFYVIDACEYMSLHTKSSDVVLFFDLDCIWLRSCVPMESVIRKDGVLNYIIDFPYDYKVHGLSRNDLRSIYTELKNEDVTEIPKIFGGEVYGFRGGKTIEEAYNMAHKIWNQCVRRFERKEPKFNTEEHLFSFVFYDLSMALGNANQFIRRIWTTSRYRTVQLSDTELILWHLPSEKRRGIFLLARDVLDYNSRFWKIPQKDWVEYIGTFVGIPHRAPKRYFRDMFARYAHLIRSILKFRG